MTRCIIASVDPEITIAHLSIVDSAWQETPDNLAVVDEAGRGTLYLLSEVVGETEGRDWITRDLIETVRREYAASRGSVTAALTEAIRAANDLLYTANADAPLESRRYAGMTAAVLRERELFMAQGGPGLACLVRDGTLARYPEESPWFDSQFDPSQAQGEYPTAGAVPIGVRRDYTPDSFHATLQPGDAVLFATRSLTHLLTNEELLNTVAHRHPDEIVENLEDLAGSADLSVISVLCEPIAADSPEPISLVPDSVARDAATPSAQEQEDAPAIAQPLKSNDAGATRDWSGVVTALASAQAKVAQIWEEIDVTRIGAAGERAIGVLLRGVAFVALGSLRVFSSEELPDQASRKSMSAGLRRQMVWRLAALIVPLLFVLMGGGAWINYRSEVARIQSAQIDQLSMQANAALEAGKNSARGGDKSAARAAFEKAKSFAQEIKTLNPIHPAARKIAFDAQDQLDLLSGISVLASAKFATLGSPTNRTRIVSHWPEIFILDREAQRIYRFVGNDAGSTATPISNDGVILKTGDKVGDRAIGDLIDILWIEAGRLVAIDRSGAFLQYDPAKSSWTARPASDGAQWARVSVAAGYAGNVYLLDPSKNQILKYTANEGTWSSGAAYLPAGINVDMSSAVDMAIDGDVWVLRSDGSFWRFASGRLADFTLRDLETPLAKPTGLTTSQAMIGLYVADAGNQRIVQFDKANGRYVRQFRPGSENRDVFAALKAIAMDEANRKVIFMSGNQVYLATTPQ